MKTILQLLLVISMIGCYSKAPKYKTGLEGELMPAIDLVLLDTNFHFNTANIRPGRPSVLFAFEPWCPYCKAQTKSILSHIESLKGIDFYFLTNASYSGFKSFYEKYQLERYNNIKAGIDYTYSFGKYFKTNQIPCMAIYDRNKKLKQVLIGKNYISLIKEAAFN
jgi:thiol-disulfide isomerase/thioredoxin